MIRKNQLQNILKLYGEEYLKKHSVPIYVRKTLVDIESCRTSQLGGHIDQCDDCGDIRISYNSCRNRHCPKCQTLAKEKWIFNQEKHLLPVGYFHMIFTIPNEFNSKLETSSNKGVRPLYKFTK